MGRSHTMARAFINAGLLGAGAFGAGYFHLHQELRRDHGEVAKSLNRVAGWDLPARLPAAPSTSAWNETLYNDLTSKWNKGVDYAYGGAKDTSQLVRGAMPFKPSELLSSANTQMRQLGMLVDDKVADFSKAKDEYQEKVESSVASTYKLVTGRGKKD